MSSLRQTFALTGVPLRRVRGDRVFSILRSHPSQITFLGAAIQIAFRGGECGPAPQGQMQSTRAGEQPRGKLFWTAVFSDRQ